MSRHGHRSRFACGTAAAAAASTLATLACLARPAFAQSPEDVAAARALGIQGLQMAEAGDCRGAIAKLQSAEALHHAPTTAEKLGECLIGTGRIVAGTEVLRALGNEPLAPGAPPAFVSARQRAQTVLQSALPRIAQLRIHVEGAPADKLTVMVDDEKVPALLLDADRPTDPGAHQVKVTAPGFLAASQGVELPEAGHGAVTVTLQPDPNAAAAAAAAAPAATAPGAMPATQPATPPPDQGASHGGSKTLPIVLLAAGGVGVVAGTVFGVLALGTKSNLDNACTNKLCPSSSTSDINSLTVQATISTIGFGVGIAGAAVGTVLLLTSGGGDATPEAPQHAAPVRVHPWIGLGGAGLSGSFR